MFANLDDSHVTVVMYSKFSSSCTNFLEILAKVPTFKHTLLCIDNEDVRKRVLSQSKLNVTEVPCIFRIYERTGYVETFEGDRAFTILNTHYNHYLEKIEKEQLLRMAPPSPPPQSQQSQLPPQMQQTQLPQQMQQMQQTQLPQQMQQTQLLPQQQQQAQLLPQQPQQNYEFDIASQPPPTTMSSTPIEQLDQSYMSNPGTGPGPGMQIDRALKSGSVNIVSRAMQMQKERESGEPASKRPV
jgi:hypothetical protein